MYKNYQIGAYEKAFPNKTSIYDMLSLSRKFNYDFFEISIDRTEQRISRLYEKKFWEECIDASRNSGIPIGSMCLSALSTYTMGNADVGISNRAMDILEKAIVFSCELGIRVIQIPGCDMPKNEQHTQVSKELYIKNLKCATEMASSYGICLAIENMEDGFMDTVQKTMEYIKLINSPYLQLYPDSGNITSANKIYNTDINDDMGHGIGHYIALHLKETKPNKYGGLFYGDGHVDFQLMVRNAWRLGVRRFVMEYWYTGNDLWKEDLMKASEMCRRWISNAV